MLLMRQRVHRRLPLKSIKLTVLNLRSVCGPGRKDDRKKALRSGLQREQDARRFAVRTDDYDCRKGCGPDCRGTTEKDDYGGGR